MQPQLASVVAQLEAARQRLHRLAARTAADRWSRRADPDRWSVGECVVHLNLTSRAYIPLIRQVLDDPGTPPAGARYRRDLLGFLLGYGVGPQPRFLRRRMRFKTGASFVPTGDTPRETAVADFDALQDQIVALARESDGRGIDRVRIASPFDPRAKYNAFSALTILPRHQQRHLIQAEEVWEGE